MHAPQNRFRHTASVRGLAKSPKRECGEECGESSPDFAVRGVYCHSKSGIGVILADAVVDATGDGGILLR